ncbi:MULTISPECIES: hypothetical protein [unclassified Rhizobium]|uniref:hypothetical protein n=1 Tax=unclassified Rhizobium TaxID=2613769 RepID=UPI001ADD01D1|nr:MULTISPECIES: hypothetical protein [unclassified Rhizobium]MBO9099988.1 hypothetical protein [Rhizobium sp. L58/93]QXZ82799.1 hypothetical protein J5287_11985 [Rhizobium sp. K1/93]QXZ89688.1 hypothetical protein J5280_16605 [Rhizobium sp. K15/93]
MQIGVIEGATRIIGKSQGYLGLPLRDAVVDCGVGGECTPVMMTAWLPTPDELERLNAGAGVILTVHGTMHPPVMIEVGDAPSLEG